MKFYSIHFFFFFLRDLNCKRNCCNLQPNTARGSRWTFNQHSLPGDWRRCHSRWAGTTRVGTPGSRVELCGTIIALLSLMSPPSIRPSVLPFSPLTKMHSPGNYHPSWTPPSCQNNHRCGLNQTKRKQKSKRNQNLHCMNHLVLVFLLLLPARAALSRPQDFLFFIQCLAKHIEDFINNSGVYRRSIKPN